MSIGKEAAGEEGANRSQEEDDGGEKTRSQGG